MIRDLILTITILCIIYIAAHQPPPIKSVEVPYCVIDYLAASKHPIWGTWEKAWVKGFGPCSLQDSYRNI